MRPNPGHVELRRVRIRIDADFANRRFRRQVAAGESIDINLPSARARRRPRHRLQLLRELVRIVRKRFQFFGMQHQRVAVRTRVGAHLPRRFLDVHHLRFRFDGELDIERLRRRDFEILLLADRESFGDHADGIFARRAASRTSIVLCRRRSRAAPGRGRGAAPKRLEPDAPEGSVTVP